MAPPLPLQLQAEIVKHVKFAGKARWEAVSKGWQRMLRRTTGSWGEVPVDDNVLQRGEQIPSMETAGVALEAWSSFIRWIEARRSAIEAVKLTCHCCSYTQTSSCTGRNRQLTAFLAFIASLPVALRIDFSCASNHHLFLEGGLGQSAGTCHKRHDTAVRSVHDREFDSGPH
ncbi:hypothetical protein WJX73_007799 [Symbiochloris irregularis]|uniref:Uncharacterized protein n=1 Tax=Symbiochloris irregularis TaxID=706552 RepID=A0AAW1P407_9CHLO